MGPSHACNLTLDQSHLLLSGMEEDPSLVHHIRLTSQKLPQLVEKNPTVAIAVVSSLVNSGQFSGYLTALGNMDVSLHSLLVMNKVARVLETPMGFPHVYVHRCFIHCRETSDQVIRRRNVQLLCTFLECLMSRKVWSVQTVKDEYMEMEPFCLEYRGLKEAASLLQVVKSLEDGVKSGDGGVKSGDGGVKSGDGGVKSGDGGVKSGDGGVKSGDGGVKSGDGGVKSGDGGVKSGGGEKFTC